MLSLESISRLHLQSNRDCMPLSIIHQTAELASRDADRLIHKALHQTKQTLKLCAVSCINSSNATDFAY